MGRPALELGTWGNISSKMNAGRNKGDQKLWTSTCWVRDLDGKKRQATGSGSSKDASRRDLLAKLKIRFISLNGIVKPETTIAELGVIWLDSREKSGTLDDSSIESYELALKHLNNAIGGVRVREMTPGLVDRTILDIHAVSASKAKRVKNVLLQMLRLAVRQGALAANPAADMEKLSRPKTEVLAMTLDEVPAVRGAIRTWMDRPRSGPPSEHLDDIFELFLGTGFRIGEVLALRWCDIDLRAGTVTAAGTVKRTKRSGLYRKANPKTEAGWRTAQLPQFALDVLRRRAEGSLTLDDELVFQTRNKKPLDPNNVRRQWRAALGGSELTWVKPHTTRKTVGTFVNDAMGTGVASKTLGHANEKTTKDHYIAKAEQSPDVRRVLDALGPQTDDADE